MFSLCIATMDRYDTFLSTYLPQYLSNPYIREIVISDENGHDVKKIQEIFPNECGSKLLLLTNEKKLGPFLNKRNAVNKATSKWVCLMDSDNFAPESYFQTAQEFIERNQLKDENHTILMPSFAKPQFNYTHLPQQFTRMMSGKPFATCFNTGNFIFTKDVYEELSLSGEDEMVAHSSACDVIYFNTLCLEQYPCLKIFIVKDMHYRHTVHKGSVYIQTHEQNKRYNEMCHQRFYSLCNEKLSEPFYCKNKDTYPPFKNGLYLEEFFLERYLRLFTTGGLKTKRKYIPALWTNFQIEGWFAKKKHAMQNALNQWYHHQPSQHGYFTVVQYDDACKLALPPNTVVYGACSGNKPIPLIYEDKNETLLKVPRNGFKGKDILCSFVGSMTSNGVQPNVREVMKNTLSKSEKFVLHFTDGWTPNVGEDKQKKFIDLTVRSKFALCPRGYGRSSFRFFEVLQLGTIPIYIYNDKNWLPFKNKIKYNEFCIVLHVSQLGVLEEKLLTIDEEKYEAMLEAYETKYKKYFTLEGMFEAIIEDVNA